MLQKEEDAAQGNYNQTVCTGKKVSDKTLVYALVQPKRAFVI